MVELTNKRIDEMLHEETVKKEDTDAILRSIYTRYMRLYEKYFSDIDALNDEKIDEFKRYHEETLSLIKYYYMDIPNDICSEIEEFEEKYSDLLLGSEWHEYLLRNYKEFKDDNLESNKDEEYYKKKFKKQVLKDFYEAMDYVFRDGFGTGSKTTESAISTLTGLILGKND